MPVAQEEVWKKDVQDILSAVDVLRTGKQASIRNIRTLWQVQLISKRYRSSMAAMRRDLKTALT